jgi:hypothetical protein
MKDESLDAFDRQPVLLNLLNSIHCATPIARTEKLYGAKK